MALLYLYVVVSGQFFLLSVLVPLKKENFNNVIRWGFGSTWWDNFYMAVQNGLKLKNVIGYEERDRIAQNVIFCYFSNLSPFQGLKSPRLPAWFVSSLGLLLHRFNVRSLSKPPVQSSEPPKQGIKRKFRMQLTRPLVPPTPEMGGASDS